MFLLIPISGRGKGSFLSPKLQTGYEVQTVIHSVGTTGSFIGINGIGMKLTTQCHLVLWLDLESQLEIIHFLCSYMHLYIPTVTHHQVLKQVYMFNSYHQISYWLSFGTCFKQNEMCLRATRAFSLNILLKFLTVNFPWSQHELSIMWIELNRPGNCVC